MGAEGDNTIAGAARKNILTVAQIEQELLRQRSTTERLSEAISRLFGSITFVGLQAIGCLAWIVVNAGKVPGVVPFDPYPFNLLALSVGLEAIVLATFVLMNQNQQLRRAEHWAHLNLQVGLLAEYENTKVLQMLQALGKRWGLEQVGQDRELKELTRITEVAALAEEIDRSRDRGEALVQEQLRQGDLP